MKDLVKHDKDLTLDDIPSSLTELISYKFPPVSAGRVFSALHSGRSIGTRLAVDRGELLYFYPGLQLHYTFSIGGRVFAFINKVSLTWTDRRKTTLKRRFFQLPTQDTEHLVQHIHNLYDMTVKHTMGGRVHPELASGTFTVHMRDLVTPFVEVGRTQKGEILVIPLEFIRDAVKLGLTPIADLRYAGQYILLFVNEDCTVRLLYVGHLLQDSLFT